MRCPFAIWLSGPEWKTSGLLEATGVTLHSAEYDLPEDDKVLYKALFSSRRASWHFTITKPPFAFIFQHYDVTQVTWHCGPGNRHTIGIEHEGVAPSKIEGEQYELLVKLLKWIAETSNWAPSWRRGDANTAVVGAIWEHRDWMPTNCAVFSNNQLDAGKLIADLKGEEDMARPTVYQPRFRPENYVLSPGGLELEHIPDQETFYQRGYVPDDVKIVNGNDPVLDRPVKYARVPDELR